jgi:hypothetical protein
VLDERLHLYPLMKESHLTNQFLLDGLATIFCGPLCISMTRRKRWMRKVGGFVDAISPILSIAWAGCMVLSFMFLTERFDSKYFPWLLISGVCPVLRMMFASLPLLRLLLTCFETWFLLMQLVLLFVSFGALDGWGMKTLFFLVCMLPGLISIILLDSHVSGVASTVAAMLFGSIYLFVFMVLLATGRIIEGDTVLHLDQFDVSLIDFVTNRLITLILFLLKNVVLLLWYPDSYVHLRSRVSKMRPQAQVTLSEAV